MSEERGKHINIAIEEAMFRLEQIFLFPNSIATGDTDGFRAMANVLCESHASLSFKGC